MYAALKAAAEKKRNTDEPSVAVPAKSPRLGMWETLKVAAEKRGVANGAGKVPAVASAKAAEPPVLNAAVAGGFASPGVVLLPLSSPRYGQGVKLESTLGSLESDTKVLVGLQRSSSPSVMGGLPFGGSRMAQSASTPAWHTCSESFWSTTPARDAHKDLGAGTEYKDSDFDEKPTSWIVAKPKRSKVTFNDQVEKEKAEVTYQSDWLMHTATTEVLKQILGGHAATEQVPSLESRRELLLLAFKRKAGKAGAELAKVRKALNIIKREAEARGLPNGGFPVSPAFAADMVRMEHVRATTASKPRGKKGGRTVGHGLRASFINMQKNMQIDINADHPLVWAAAPTPEQGKSDKAGSLPIKVRVHIETLAAECTHLPTRRWCQSFTAFGLCPCLRLAEVLRAKAATDPEDPHGVIRGTTTMKDGATMEVIAPAEGFTGTFTWFQDYLNWADGRQNVLPGAKYPKGAAGDITKAESLTAEVMTEAHARKSFQAVLALEPLCYTEAQMKELDIRGHSPHGSLSDMVMYIGEGQGFTPTDQDILANWRRRAVEAEQGAGKSGASYEPRPSTSRASDMRVAYSIGDAKGGNRERQLETRTRLNAFVQKALLTWGKSWMDLPHGRTDWEILRKQDELDPDVDLTEESDSDE